MNFLSWTDVDLFMPWLCMTRSIWAGFFGIKDNALGVGALMDETKLKVEYTRYYDWVRENVPREKLLEMRIGEGWERLCSFLGRPVPTVPYPRANDTKAFEGSLEVLVGQALLRFAWRVALALIGLLVGLAWQLRPGR